MQRRDEDTRWMKGDEEEEGGGRRRRDGRRRSLLANVVNAGKQNDIILKVPKLFAFGAVLADVVKEGKQNYIILKVQKSVAVNRGSERRKAKRHNSKISKIRCCQWRKAWRKAKRHNS